MLINRLYIDGYKNLSNCTLYPSNLLALTGCNGSGKSNLLEVFRFVQAIIFGSDEDRKSILLEGVSPRTSFWFPEVKRQEELRDFKFEIEITFEYNKRKWEFFYSLVISAPLLEGENGKIKGLNRIKEESAQFREHGKRGQMKKLFNRDQKGFSTVFYENIRKNQKFSTAQNLSIIKAIQVREADHFNSNFPILNGFLVKLQNIVFVRINPEVFLTPYSVIINNIYGSQVNGSNEFISLWNSLKKIKASPSLWRLYKEWFKILSNIDDIIVDELKSTSSIEIKDQNLKIDTRKYIGIKQGFAFFLVDSISQGTKIIIKILTTLFSLTDTDEPIIIEEPESYLHPKAIIDLIRLIREESGHRTIILSTHSPVLLNSMKPDEVVLMKPIGENRYTSTKVSDIKEAVNTLEHGFVSLGDLMQTNFTIDEEKY